AQPATFIAFDILRDGKEDLTRLPLTERRKRLEQVFDQIFGLSRNFRLKAEATGVKKKRGAGSPASASPASTSPTSASPASTAPTSGSPSKPRSFRLQAEDQIIRLSEQVSDDATGMHERAIKEKWEGLIAKDASSIYQPGRRSPAWRKIKLVQEQEFVVGGWTEP